MNKLITCLMSLTFAFSQTPIVLETDYVGDTVKVVGDYNIAKNNTPVAFSNVDKEVLDMNESQDLGYQISNTPGVYIRNDVGSFGQTKIWVRGFDEQRLNVSVNNIPLSDPTARLVWWPNWEVLKDNAEQLQVQRGVSSSLYGLGNLGGSVHINTEQPSEKKTEVIYENGDGDPSNIKLSVNRTTEDYKIYLHYHKDYGYRVGQYQEQFGYYFGFKKKLGGHNFRGAFHGAPQIYTFHFYGKTPEEWTRYGRDHSKNAHVEVSNVEEDRVLTIGDAIKLPTHTPKNLAGSWLKTSGDRASLDNNAYHKPTFELHHDYQISDDLEITNTAYYTLGNGYLALLDKWFFVNRDEDGLMSWETLNQGAPWYPNLHQYSSWVDHDHIGLVTTLEKTFDNSKVFLGIDNQMYWSHVTAFVNNGFGAGGTSYYYDIGGESTALPEGGTLWDYNVEKPSSNIFVRGLHNIGKFSLMADLQYSMFSYNIDEKMPNTNNTTGSPITWKKEFRTFAPKAGILYRHNDDLVARLGVSKSLNEPRMRAMFNYGAPKSDIVMEEVINTEVGVQYKSFGLNLYNMDFSGKNLLITDVEKANTDDYDYKGRKYVPIGDATYQGLELFGSVNLPYNLSANVNYSLSKNVWGEPFGEEGRNVLYQDENDTDEKYEVGYPQTMLTGSLNYSKEKIRATISSRYYKDIYILENNGEVSVDGYLDENDEWVSTEDSATLPTSLVTDLSLKYDVNKNIELGLFISNLLDTEYWASGSSFGFQPGAPRQTAISFKYKF